MNKYKNIIFDIDGTIVDSEQTGIRSLSKTVLELTGKKMSDEELYVFFGTPSARAAEVVGYDDPVKFTEVWDKHFLELAWLIKPFPGIVEVIEELKKEGYVVGVCTSRAHLEFMNDDVVRKFSHLFDYVVCADDTERHKPFPDPALACLKKASAVAGKEIQACESLYVGDTDHDYHCGHDAGCDFALADWHGRGWQGIDAQYIFSTAEELLAAIRS